MTWIDWLAVYWFGIKLLLYLGGIVILVSSIDDFFIDICFWFNKLRNRLRGIRGTSREPFELDEIPQLPIAIMVPAWQEAPVVGKMAELAANRFQYEHFHVFIGTYPNDPDTQHEVDKVVATNPNVHKVVCALPGPTTKADCLNNVITRIFQFEKDHDMHFECIVFHDAEDVVHGQELKVFNYWVREYDLIQLPVIPIPRPWHWFTAGHYNDEFVELHSKDINVRKMLSDNVPSAGVGTGFSRRAIASLYAHNKGQVFNTGSLTEDYDIGFQLVLSGHKEIFVQQRVPTDSRWRRDYVAVRAFFPHEFQRAVRQKSRWIVGIVFQGYQRIGWVGSFAMRYILYRDRKAVLTNPANLLAYYVAANIVAMTTIHFFWEDAITFPSLIYDDSWLMNLVLINGLFLTNRVLQRLYFVSRIFGFMEGFLSTPRIVWGNVINFFAFVRALGQFRGAKKSGKEVAWDKTTHEFPDVENIK